MQRQALESMIRLDPTGTEGVSARDVARDWGLESDRSTRASAHTMMERLAAAGYAERVNGRPARYRLTGNAKERSSPP